MITFKAQTRKNQTKDDGKTNIKIRISHNGKTRYISTKFNVEPAQFDNRVGQVITRKHENASFINTNLRNKISAYEKVTNELDSRIDHIDIHSLMQLLKQSTNGKADFLSHMDRYIEELNEAGRDSYAKSIQQTKDRLIDFTCSEKLPFKELNYHFLQRFEGHYAKKGMRVNSIALHHRNMRTIFNNAINRDLVGQDIYPYRKYKIKKESTKNRDLKINELAKLSSFQFESRSVERARDLFMLSFYLLGVNMKDLINAREEQFQRGRFRYRRSKTHKEYTIKVLPEAMIIINKYRGTEGYLLNLMEKKQKNTKKSNRTTPQYKDIVDHFNKLLKTASLQCDIGNELSTY
jgi:hypothetical protein